MIKFAVSAALEKLPESQPVTLRGDINEVCETAAKIGYDAVELHVKEPLRYDAGRIRECAESCGLSICAVANGMEYTVNRLSLISEAEPERRLAIDRLREHADFAAGLRAKLIVGIMRGNIPQNAERDDCVRRFRESLSEICGYAALTDTEVVLESIVRYINNYLNSVPETMGFIQSLGAPNLSLHMDTHSMAVEEGDMCVSVRYCMGKPLSYVHYSDNNRMYPGGGYLDFKAITHALLDIGYDGFVTVECLPHPDPLASAQRAFDYLSGMMKMVEIERLSRI